MGKQKSILNMTYKEARNFLLKEESYVTMSFPPYFDFAAVIKNADELLREKNNTLNNLCKNNRALSEAESVHYKLLDNKDGEYAWRALEILHPLVYVDLVNTITQKNSWKEICDRFEEFESNDHIECVSIPLETEKTSDIAGIINNWWINFEQRQIELAMDYEYCIHTDITNCYGSIYTHSIAWAVHGKRWSKSNRKKGLGNRIDKKIQNSQNGQTNGIPQGSVLMDFIAELVLGYGDKLLEERLEEHDIEKYKILRYRDDYRIFSNQKDQAEKITRVLSEVLAELNFKMNPQKTFITEDIILDAVKEPKIYWDLVNTSLLDDENKYKIGLQKHLFQIKLLANKFPNSKTINKALLEIYKNRIEQLKKAPKNINQLISLVINIMTSNPTTIEVCVGILSKIFSLISIEEMDIFVEKILTKYSRIPNTDYAELWIQRLTLPYKKEIKFQSTICKKVQDSWLENLWDSEWIDGYFDEISLIDDNFMEDLQPVILSNEIDLFKVEY